MIQKIRLLSIVLVFTFFLQPIVAQSAGWFSCEVEEIMEFQTRVHVKCTNSINILGNNISFLAIDKSDPDELERFVSYATTALALSYYFRVWVPNAASAMGNCQSTNCRTPTSFGVRR